MSQAHPLDRNLPRLEFAGAEEARLGRVAQAIMARICLLKFEDGLPYPLQMQHTCVVQAKSYEGTMWSLEGR